ncbi:helix-turn-helix domain-containing protein [Hymenobacter arizonensis]|uniref:Helix-turn-helix n=1 Tax=Hymenobacter arizonensis TaxID=1227077 RepID=A0A1I5ULV9_HYMAR|nr:helix-turn-helix transcriptional regulator [Hymenobacter arizonensis]SFP96149.1 Helix-turn-helix [Hymenobacter arizonensis]
MVERIRTLLEVRQLTPTQFADAIGIARPIVSHILSGRNKPSLEVVQRILAAMPDLSMPWLLNGTGPMLAGAAQAVEPVVSPSALPIPIKEAEAEEVPAPNPLPAAPSVPDAPAIAAQGRRRSTPPAAVAPPAKVPAAPPRPALKRFAPTTPKPAGAQAVAPPEVSTSPVPEPVPQPVAAAAEPPAPAVVQPVEPVPPPAPVSPAPVVPTIADGSATAAALFARAEKPIRRIVIFYRDGSFADYQPE